MIGDARNWSRRCTMVTCDAMRARKSASSIAESPPPTTTIGLSRKKKPSQVAQVDTPKPRRRLSLGRSSQRADAPVEMITLRRGAPRRPPTRGRARREIDARHVRRLEVGAEALGLGAHGLHQLGTLDAVGEAGEVLDVAGQHELTARAEALGHVGRQVRPRGVDCRGVTRRPSTDDHHVVDVGHLLLLVTPSMDTHGGMLAPCPPPARSARAPWSSPSSPGSSR